MDAADSAGAQEADPGCAAGGERAADGRRADGALDDRSREVARADLARVCREPLELGVREADAERAVEHADRRRQGARVADGPRGLEPDGHSLACREAVRDERRLERDDRRAASKCVRDLGRDPDHGIAPSWATQRAAAWAASSGPPTR